MKKLVLAALLLATSAHAEWVRTGVSDNHVSYIDPATIKKVNNAVVSVWVLQDYNRTQRTGELSSALLFHFNCNTLQNRLLQYTNYSGQMMQGFTLGTNDRSTDWAYNVPGSIGDTITGIVCGMKL
jgi:hypothetical protein